MRRGLYILIFVIVSSLNIIFCVDSKADSEVFSINDGLSQSLITCLFLDSEGYLWIGTQDGLNLYDGYDFEVFRSQPRDSTSISGDYILTINEDKYGFLWIGTTSGLNRFNKKTREFKKYYSGFFGGNGNNDNSVFYIFKDSQEQLWIKTLTSLNRYIEETDSFSNVPLYNDTSTFFLEANYFQIAEESQSILWVGTKDGVNRLDFNDFSKSKRYYHQTLNNNSLSDNRVKSILKDSNGNIWIGTAEGLNKYIPEKDGFERLYPSKNKRLNLGDDINFLLQLKESTILVGTGKGLCKINVNTNEITESNLFHSYESHLNNNYFTTAIIDSSNILWLGTHRGIIKKDLKGKKFELHNEVKNPFPGIGEYDFASIAKDDLNRLWLGTWGEGLRIISQGRTKIFRSGQANYPFNVQNDYVHSIFFKDNNEAWLGTRDGIIVFNIKTERSRRFCDIKSRVPCLIMQDSRVNTIFRKDKSIYLIGTDQGLIHYNEMDAKILKYNSFETNSTPISFDVIQCITRDKNSNIWFGTNKGVIKTNNSLDVLDYFNSDTKNKTQNTISNNNINTIYEASNGRIWIGTRSGLNLFVPESKSFKIYTEMEGLPNNMIYAIHEDSKGNLWISTNHGLAKFDPATEQVFSYNMFDGLQNYEYNIGASFKDKNGKLYFGGISGLNAFYPDSVQENPYLPNVVITSIEYVDMEGVKRELFTGDTLIRIKTKSQITINYSALDYTNPSENKYKYSLHSKGKKNGNGWKEVGNTKSVTFPDLSPGNYIFQVIGTNNDGLESRTSAAVEILVKPKIWESKAAYLLYLLMVMGFVYSFVNYRTRTLRKLNREYKERERISKQVQKQKEELALKNKNITDSINYAKRIQEAVMPSVSTVKRILPESFVLHMPKDIVSGDFYWVHEKSNKVFIAAVDCTGHGVPGAFMSIIGFELFRKITNTQGIEDPSIILNTLNADFAEIFGDVADFTLRDGMDIAFCVYDKKSKILDYAGAFNPLYIIRDNKISEIKGDRFSVGIETYPEEEKVFKNHSISLENDDIVYIFSDGYADQFGGPEGKKYKYRRFRHLLLTIHKLPVEIQRDLLQKSILEWKGELDQVDDILVIGFKAG